MSPIISTCVYGGVAIMNACRYCMVTTVIMAIVSSAYIVLFLNICEKGKFIVLIIIGRGYHVKKSM